MKAIKSGWKTCPTKSLPAAEFEAEVVDQIRCLAQDDGLRAEVLKQACSATETDLAELTTQQRQLERQLGRDHAEISRLAVTAEPSSATTPRIADLHERVSRAEQQLAKVRSRVAEVEGQRINQEDVNAAFADFDNVWNALSSREQAQVLALLVARVEFDPADSTLAISFHPSAIRTLAEGTHNAKGAALLAALDRAFAEASRLGAAQKAIIFTESRRTQEYLQRLLADSPYAEGVVLFNGSNTDPQSRAIYAEWVERHQGKDRVTGSKSSDMRSALVDYFREQGRIMIATEAGAEGINLQFCSLVVNYDLPWKPASDTSATSTWQADISAQKSILETGVGHLGNFYWLPGPPNPGTNPLHAECHVIVVAYKHRINFPTPNDEQTVRYVLSRIRSHCP